MTDPTRLKTVWYRRVSLGRGKASSSFGGRSRFRNEPRLRRCRIVPLPASRRARPVAESVPVGARRKVVPTRPPCQFCHRCNTPSDPEGSRHWGRLLAVAATGAEVARKALEEPLEVRLGVAPWWRTLLPA